MHTHTIQDTHYTHTHTHPHTPNTNYAHATHYTPTKHTVYTLMVRHISITHTHTHIKYTGNSMRPTSFTHLTSC